MNALTGETPVRSQTTVEETTAFAASVDTDTSQIALPGICRDANRDPEQALHDGFVHRRRSRAYLALF